jgi:hypothetical protein
VATQTTAVTATRTDPNHLIVRTFLAPAGFFPATPGAPVDVKQELMDRGIEFPAGASVTYLPGTSKLIVWNTPDEEDKIEALDVDARNGVWIPGGWNNEQTPETNLLTHGTTLPSATFSKMRLIPFSAQSW